MPKHSQITTIPDSWTTWTTLTSASDLAYLEAVHEAMVDENPAIAAWLTIRCHECDRALNEADEDHRLLGGWVVIGCGGYRHIDPNAVGIDQPGWLPYEPPL